MSAPTLTPRAQRLHTGMFIGGAWREATGGHVHAVTDPAIGEVIARVADASVGDCLAAVDAAADAAVGWAATQPRHRAEILRRAWEILHTEREDIAHLIVAENGKCWTDALAEADYAAEFFR